MLYEYPINGYNHYSVTVLSLSYLRFNFLSSLRQLSIDFNIKDDEEESLYDWLVCESLNQILKVSHNVTVDKHYRHDVYKCIYDTLGPVFEHNMKSQLKQHNLQFLIGERVKVLIAGEVLFLAKGIL
jgi:hypothetical protein